MSFLYVVVFLCLLEIFVNLGWGFYFCILFLFFFLVVKPFLDLISPFSLFEITFDFV